MKLIRILLGVLCLYGLSPAEVRLPPLENDAAVRAAAAAVPRNLRVTAGITAGTAPEGFRIRVEAGEYRVESPTPLGLAYGLYALVEEPAPTERAPALAHRMVLMRAPAGVAEFERRLRQVVENGANAVVFWGTENYVPWDGATAAESARRRAQLAEFLKLAHAWRLRLYLFGTELLAPAEVIESLGPSPADAAIAEVLRDKYRRLLRAVPDLDGVATMPGEQYPHGPFRRLEVIRGGESLGPSYRAFLKAIHGVVVGEFGKMFVNLTWATNDFEQHSAAPVYRRVFNSDVSPENLLLAIKPTRVDQWYYGTGFNPTFGVTPHQTIAHLETGSSYHGLGTMLDFPARFFQAGLEWAAERDARGVFYAFPQRGLLEQGMFYVISRLAWEPRASADELAERWARRAFGPQAAPEMARLLLGSGELLRSGWYLRPSSLRGWNPLPLVRVESFVAAGRPLWDRGRNHERFLHSVYLEAKPWLKETRTELERGARLAEEARGRYLSLESRINPPETRDEMRRIIEHTRSALALNRAYAEAVFAYFAYRDRPEPARHAELEQAAAALRQAISSYKASFSFFRTRGPEALLELAARRLKDNAAAEAYLREAPTDAEIQRRFAAARREAEEWLRSHPDAVKLGAWEGSVDGSDILTLRGDRVEIEHLEDDPITAPGYTPASALPPDFTGTVVVRVVEARGTVIILEQPSAANRHAARIYLEDPAGGPAVFRLEFWRSATPKPATSSTPPATPRARHPSTTVTSVVTRPPVAILRTRGLPKRLALASSENAAVSSAPGKELAK